MIWWNATLKITILKNKAGVLKPAVYNTPGQYFLATFTYNVRTAGVKKKAGGRERLFMF